MHILPPAGDWSALTGRLAAGEVFALFSWGFYKLGSQKLILRDKSLCILTWGLRWTLARDEIQYVVTTPASLTIFLVDGTRVRPSMFWSSGPGSCISVIAGSRTSHPEKRFATRRQIGVRFLVLKKPEKELRAFADGGLALMRCF